MAAETLDKGPALMLLNGGRMAEATLARVSPALKAESAGPPAYLLAMALDTMAEAAMFVGRSGRIVYANRAAKLLLGSGDVLREARGYVEPSDQAQRAAMARIVNDAATMGVVGAVSLIGRGGARVNLTAVPGERGGAAQVLLLASGMRRGEDHIIAQLQQAFGLTAAEADIARCLGAGESAADIAAHRGASPGTVHCQIKAVAAKLGCRRRTEIAAIVQAMPRINHVQAAPAAPMAVA